MDPNEILKKILRRYGVLTENIRALQRIESRIQKKIATYADAEEASRQIGRALTTALKENLPDALTDGMLYRAIAEVVVEQPMKAAGKDVARFAEEIQREMNESAGIGINPIVPKMNQNQIDGIITGICNAESYETGKDTLFAQTENCLEGYVDDFVRENADFQYKAGLSPTIERRAQGNCCKWCSQLAGTYLYEEVKNSGNDVFKRHKYCHCQILFNPGNGSKRRQDVHNKRWTEDRERGIIESRRSFDPFDQSRPAEHEMANGPRRGTFQHVSAEEERKLRKDADDLGIPQDVLSFNTGSRTSFDDVSQRINIRGDVFPADYAVNPESILNERCVLAHEYYGHMLHYPSRFNIGDWRDEFEASYSAALNTPNLTDSERSLLMIDAFDRAKAAGIRTTMNKEARRIIYGADY